MTTELHDANEGEPPEVSEPRQLAPAESRGSRARAADATIWALGLALCATVFGALPFLVSPTSWQAIWTMGFAESLANGPVWELRARDFGLPEPASIAFGLAGALPASMLLRLGVPPADAYTLMVLGWLTVAYWGAYRVAVLVGAPARTAVFAAVAWLCMPMVWGHAHYSQVGLGLALLPSYLLPTILVVTRKPGTPIPFQRVFGLYLAAAIVAVFMDGYTFVMFAVGTATILAYQALRVPELRTSIVRRASPAFLIGLGAAYGLYTGYLGRTSFDAPETEFLRANANAVVVVSRIEVFRALGIDVGYLLVPTGGMHWVADLVRFGVDRPPWEHWGDFSVYTTTFALPLLVLGSAAWLRTRRETPLATAFLLLAGFSLYMALGPSLKFFSAGPNGAPGYLMPSDAALVPTGNALLSETLPGFEAMRATYRWFALCALAMWFLVVLWARSVRVGEATRRGGTVALVAITAFNVPDIPVKLQIDREYRSSFQRVDRELVPLLREHVASGETAAFVPWRNDFLANFVAARAGFRTFNIGGDKNVAIAYAHWPSEMRAAGPGTRTAQDFAAAAAWTQPDTIVRLLKGGGADVVLLPYTSLDTSVWAWPCGKTSRTLTHRTRATPSVDRSCIEVTKQELGPLMDGLSQREDLAVQQTALFASVRLR